MVAGALRAPPQSVGCELAVLVVFIAGSDALHDAGNAVPIAIAAPRQPRPITESRAGDLAVLADS